MNEDELEELTKVENLINLLRFKVIDVLNDKCELRYEVSARRAQIDTFVKTNRELRSENVKLNTQLTELNALRDALRADNDGLRTKLYALRAEFSELERLNNI